MSLYQAYKDYYSSLVEPEKYTSSTGFVSSEFLDNLLGHFADTCLDVSYFQLWQQYARQFPAIVPRNRRHLLTTGGTTRNVRRWYFFGPHFDYVKRALWNMRMFPTGPSTIVPLVCRFKEKHEPRLVNGFSVLYSTSILSGRLDSDSIQPLIQILDSINGKVTLLAEPDALLYLNKNPSFVEYCVRSKDRINLISQNWECFYRKQELVQQGVHVSDVMMDWSTGINFHMCSKRQYHVLPISIGQQNLLNLVPLDVEWQANSDLFEPWGLVDCECGKKRLHFMYHQHYLANIGMANGYDLNIAEKLETNFQSIQFHQNETYLTIFYEAETDITSSDREFLTEYWSSFGYSVLWKEHEHYQTPGYKRPTFFRWLP